MSDNNQAWSIESWCNDQKPITFGATNDIANHAATTNNDAFLKKLNMPFMHPFCDNTSQYYHRPYDIDGIPKQGPLRLFDYENHKHLFNNNIFDYLISCVTMIIPPFIAMLELWLRLFALIIAPIGITYLFYILLNPFPECNNKNNRNKNNITNKTNKKTKARNYNTHGTATTNPSSFLAYLPIICTLTTASCLVLATDSLYILEFGPKIGCISFAASFLLSIHTCIEYKLIKTLFLQITILLLVGVLLVNFETMSIQFGSSIENVQIQEGLYYDRKCLLIFSKVALLKLFALIPPLSQSPLYCIFPIIPIFMLYVFIYTINIHLNVCNRIECIYKKFSAKPLVK